MVANKYAKYVQPTPAPQPEQQPAPASQNKYRKYLQPAPEPAAPSANAANPIVTAQRQSQTQAMSQWAAQQEARKAAEAADAARRQQARREASRVNMGDFIVDENAAPIQTEYEKDIGKGMAGAPLSFGQGLAEGGANLINNVTNIGAEGLNAANRLLLGPKAYQFTGTNIQVPRNVLIGEGAPLESVTGALPRGAGQMMAVRMPLGKLKPGGGLPGMAIKDAASFAATTDKDTPRLVDMLPAGTPIASALQSRDGESYTEAFLKNAAEDLTMSGASAGVMKAIEWAMGAGGSAGRQAARAPEPEPTPAPAPQAPAPTVQPFSAPAEPAGGGLMRNIGTRAVGGGIGATLGGVGDAIAAEGDGSRGGPDIINPVTGAAAGIFGPQVVSRAWRAGVRPFRPPGFDERVASRVVRNALSPVGRTADEIAAAKVAQFGDKPAPLADLTQQGQNLAVGLTRLPGQAGQLAVEQSDDVMRTRTGRLFSDVETTTKINPASVAGDLDEAIKAASEEISPAYEQLFAKHAGVNSERLMQLMEDPIVKPYLRRAIQASESLATTAGQAPSNARIWDLVKRGLDRTIEGQKRSSGQAAYELEKARAAIKDELDALMPEYKAVRDAADAPRMRAARDEGKKIAGGNVLVERVRKIASDLKGKPLTALQMGAVEQLALDIERGRGIDGIASERMREILGAVFDDDTAAKLVARIRADQTIIKNAQRRNPNLGSATSQAAMGGAGGIQNAADLAQNALALKTNPLGTVLAALSKSGTYTKAQRDLIAQMLLGGADPENLARIYGRRGGPTRGQSTPPAGPPVNPLTPPRRPPEQAGFGATATGLGGAGGAVAGTALAPDTNGDGVIDAQELMAGGMGGLVSGLVGGGLAGAGANRLLGPRRGAPPKAAPQKPPAQSGFGGGNSGARAERKVFDVPKVNKSIMNPKADLGMHEIIRNPSQSDLMRMTKGPASDGRSSIRYFKDEDGNIYVANAYDTTHYAMMRATGSGKSVELGYLDRTPDNKFQVKVGDGDMDINDLVVFPMTGQWLRGDVPSPPGPKPRR